MRKLEKLLSLLLVIVMMITLNLPAASAEVKYVYYADEDGNIIKGSHESEAVQLNKVGLYNGISTQRFDPDLGAPLDRQTGVTMLLRMFGQEDEALLLSDADANAKLTKFTDGGTVAAWAKKQVAYAVDKGFVKGIENKGSFSFQPQAPLVGKAYASLILQQLGYNGDFTYNESLTKLEKVGGLTAGQAVSFDKALIKDDVVGMTYHSLQAKYKADGKSVIKALLDSGDVKKEELDKAKITYAYVKEVEAIKIYMALGEKLPQLPGTVKAMFDNGTTADVAVTWSNDDIQAIDTKKPGTYTIHGLMANTSVQAVAEVTVQGDFISVDDVDILVKVGGKPVLPGTVKVNCLDGVTIEMPVTWDAHDISTKEQGQITVFGTISDLTMKREPIRVAATITCYKFLFYQYPKIPSMDDQLEYGVAVLKSLPLTLEPGSLTYWAHTLSGKELGNEYYYYDLIKELKYYKIPLNGLIIQKLLYKTGAPIEMTVLPGEEIKLTDTIKLSAEDGLQKQFDVLWKENVVNSIDTNVPGIYFIQGYIQELARNIVAKVTIPANGYVKDPGTLDIGIIEVEKGEKLKTGSVIQVVKVKADGETDGEYSISWEDVDTSKVGEFKVQKPVAGYYRQKDSKEAAYAEATIHVLRKIKTIQDVEINVLQNGDALSELPKEVGVTYDDNTTGKLQVTWPEKVNTKVSVTFKIEGSIKGYTKKAAATVNVKTETIADDSPDTPPHMALSEMVYSVEAIATNTIKINMKSNYEFRTLDDSKIHFIEAGNPNSAVALTATTQNVTANAATFTLSQSLSEDCKLDGSDADTTPSVLKVHFDAGAIILSSGAISQALAPANALTVEDKIVPTLNKIYVKADSGEDQNIVVVEFNEPVTIGNGDPGFSITDNMEGVTFEYGTEYTVSEDAGKINITMINTNFTDPFGVTVELTNGLQISDQAGNHPSSFDPTGIRNAADTAEGSILVQNIKSVEYEQRAPGDLDDYGRIVITLSQTINSSELTEEDITVEFDNSDVAIQDIIFAQDQSDFILSVLNGRLILNLTSDGLDKIDSIDEFNSGNLRITIDHQYRDVDPSFDVTSPTETQYLFHSMIAGAD